MSRVFEARRTKDTKTVPGHTIIGWSIPSDATELIEEILAWFGLGADLYIRSHAYQYLKDYQNDQEWPWAVIFFNAEFPLAGHVARLRHVERNMPTNAYSWATKEDRSVGPGRVPPVSVIDVMRKPILQYAAERSPLFAPAWDALKDKAEDRQWFYVSDSPPADWVKKTAVGDEELFLRYLEREMSDRHTAVVALKARTMEQRANFMRGLLKANPDLPEAWDALGASLLSLGQLEAAIDALKRAHEMKPYWAYPLRSLALAYEDLRDMERTLELMDQVLELDPFNESALHHMADVCGKAGQKDRAVDMYHRYLVLAPWNVHVWETLSCLLHELGRDSEAIVACEKVLQHQSKHADAWTEPEPKWTWPGGFAEAHEACKQALTKPIVRRFPAFSSPVRRLSGSTLTEPALSFRNDN